jgi:hypothetical protein
MNRNRRNKYEVVDHLPENAVNVLDYAINKGTTKQNIYNIWRRSKETGKQPNFKIVIFKGFNFIIEN